MALFLIHRQRKISLCDRRAWAEALAWAIYERDHDIIAAILKKSFYLPALLENLANEILKEEEDGSRIPNRELIDPILMSFSETPIALIQEFIDELGHKFQEEDVLVLFAFAIKKNDQKLLAFMNLSH